MTELFIQNVVPELSLNDIFGGLSESGSPSNDSNVDSNVLTDQRIIGGSIERASYRSAENGARFEIFPEYNPNIGLVVYNAANTIVFEVLIDGADVGDVILGNYSGGQGAKWDQSAGTFTVLGSITATTGAIGGFNIGADYIRDAADSFGLASTVTAGDDIRFWAGATFANRASAPVKITEAGVLTATGASISGTITIVSGSGYANISDKPTTLSSINSGEGTKLAGIAAGATVGADWNANLLNIPATLGTPSGAGLYLSSTYIGYYTGAAWNSYIDSSGNFYFKGDANSSIDWNITTVATLTIKGKIVAGTGSSIGTGYLSGLVGQANLNIANRGWVQTCAFTVTDADTIAWGAGILTSADGTAYNIDAGNTGNMVAKTYIYLDTAVSLTVYQTTTTATTAVGAGKVLIAIAQNGTTEATFKVMQGQGGENIDAANIVAGSITANEIAASTITSAKMNVSQLSAISADLGAITAGTITMPTTGYIKGGMTDYLTGTGFFLGYSGAAYKFSVGNPSGNYISWDGTTLTVNGYALTSEVRYAAGNYLVASADAQDTTSNQAYTKVRQIVITKAGTLRVKFDIQASAATGSGYVSGKIYRNGVAVGSAQNRNNGDANWETKSEDISGWSRGDLVQLYVLQTQAGYGVVNRNFRVYADAPDVSAEVAI